MGKESNIIRRLNRFHCKCNVSHEILVWVCSAHLNNETMTNQTPMNCICKNLAQYELCSGCVERRYQINF